MKSSTPRLDRPIGDAIHNEQSKQCLIASSEPSPDALGSTFNHNRLVLTRNLRGFTISVGCQSLSFSTIDELLIELAGWGRNHAGKVREWVEEYRKQISELTPKA